MQVRSNLLNTYQNWICVKTSPFKVLKSKKKNWNNNYDTWQKKKRQQDKHGCCRTLTSKQYLCYLCIIKDCVVHKVTNIFIVVWVITVDSFFAAFNFFYEKFHYYWYNGMAMIRFKHHTIIPKFHFVTKKLSSLGRKMQIFVCLFFE